MYSYLKNIFIFVFYSAVFAYSNGDEAADAALQKSFKELDDDMAAVRDHCLQENSMTLTDVKNYNKADDVPENNLCFYKCFYQQIGFVDDGKIVIDVLKLIPDLKGLDKKKVEELTQCVKDIDEIKECEDVRQIEDCFNKFQV